MTLTTDTSVSTFSVTFDLSAIFKLTRFLSIALRAGLRDETARQLPGVPIDKRH
jgi:hypothetical protein